MLEFLNIIMLLNIGITVCLVFKYTKPDSSPDKLIAFDKRNSYISLFLISIILCVWLGGNWEQQAPKQRG